MSSSNRARDPTQTTIRQLFASQIECAEPECHAPLFYEDTHGNRKITAEVAHIAAASPAGPRFNPGLSEDEVRSYDNLVLLCETHHKVVDSFPDDYPTTALAAWKRTAVVAPTDLRLTEGEIAHVLDVKTELGSLRTLLSGPTGDNHRLRMDLLVDPLTDRFAGRAAELAALAATPPGSIQLLIGGPGEGKSAIAAALVKRWKSDQWPAERRPLLVYTFVNRQRGWAASDTYLKTINAQLADLLGEPVSHRNHLTDLETDNAALWTKVTADDGPLGNSHVFLLVDGLDEQATGLQPTVSQLIARAASDRVAVVLTSRPAPDPSTQVDLSRFQKSQAPIALGRLTENDVAELLGDIRAAGDTGARVLTLTKGHALYVRFVVDDVRSEGPGILDQLDPSRLGGVRDYVRYQMEDLGQSATDLTWEILKTSVATLGPISVDDVDRFLRWRSLPASPFWLELGSLDRRKCTEAIWPIRRYLTGEDVAINHLELEHIVREYFGSDAVGHARQALCAWGLEWWDSSASISPPAYLREHWIEHLTQAGDWDLAEQVVTALPDGAPGARQRWASARYRAEGTYSGYLRDVDSIWRHAQTRGYAGLELGYRCALITGTIRSISANLPPELLVGLVKIGTVEGKWSSAAALQQARQKPAATDQATALIALLRAGAVSADHVLEAAAAMSDERLRADVLAALAGYLPQEAFKAGNGLASESLRARVLEALAGSLPVEVLTAARAMSDERYGAEVLAALVDYLPQEAFKTGNGLASESLRARVLEALAGSQPAEVLTAARAMSDERNRARLLVALAENLPDEVLEDAHKLASEAHRVDVLAAVAGYLPATERRSVLRSVKRAAAEIDDLGHRSGILAAIAPYLSDPERQTAITEALFAANGILEERVRARVLAGLAHMIPDRVLATTRGFEDEAMFAEVLVALGEYRPAEVHRSALDMASPWYRASVLAALAPHFPPAQRTQVLTDALEAANNIGDERLRAEALIALGEHLPTEAREAARGIESPWYQASVLAALAPQFPPADQQTLLTAALEAANDIGDSPLGAEVANALTPPFQFGSRRAALTAALESARGDTGRRVRTRVGRMMTEHPLEDLLEVAGTTYDWHLRAQVYITLAEVLPLEVLEAARREHDWQRPQLLRALAETHPDNVLATAADLPDEEYRAQVLISLAEARPDEVLAAADSIANEASRAEVLISLANARPDGVRKLATCISDDQLLARVSTALTEQDMEEAAEFAYGVPSAQFPQDEQWVDFAHGWSPFGPGHIEFPSAVLMRLAQTHPERLLAAIQGISDDQLKDEVSALVEQAAANGPTEISDESHVWLPAEALASLARALPLEMLEANQDPRGRHQFSVLAILANTIPDEVLAIAADLPDEDYRALVLISLAAMRPNEVLTVTGTLSQEEARAGVLLELARIVSTDVGMPAEDLDDQDRHGAAFVDSAVDLPTKVLAAIGSMLEERYRVPVLIALAVAIPARVVEAAETITDDQCRAEVLTAVGPRLPEGERRPVLAAAFESASRIVAERVRARLLTDLAEYLPQQVLEATKQITNERVRSDLLLILAVAIPARVVEAAETITDDQCRAEVLTAVGPRLPEGERRPVLAAAFESASRIDAERVRARLLTDLAEYLPQQVLEATKQITNEQVRSDLLLALAGDLADQVLEASKTITYEPVRARVLSDLAGDLPLLVLDAAKELTQDRAREQVLEALVPHLAASAHSGNNVEHQERWQTTVATLSRAGRPSLLTATASLAEWFALVVPPSGLHEMVGDVNRVIDCSW